MALPVQHVRTYSAEVHTVFEITLDELFEKIFFMNVALGILLLLTSFWRIFYLDVTFFKNNLLKIQKKNTL
jgi:hypothetical protein